MKKLLLLTLCMILLSAMLFACDSNDTEESNDGFGTNADTSAGTNNGDNSTTDNSNDSQQNDNEQSEFGIPPATPGVQNPVVRLWMSDGSGIELILYYDRAPNTVRNFIALAQDGFYDGLIFHRVSPTFMIQGGCPSGAGNGGPGYSIPCETADNPSHQRGVLSMAHAGTNTGGSQFFIMTADAPHLDGRHTAFGRVASDMCLDSVDIIANQSGIMSADRTVRPSDPLYIDRVEVETYGHTFAPPVTIPR